MGPLLKKGGNYTGIDFSETRFTYDSPYSKPTSNDFAKKIAEQLGISGKAENKIDGSVDIYAKGDDSAIETFIGHLKMGPALARVDSVESNEVEGELKYSFFDVC